MLIAVLLWGIQLIIWKIRNKRYKVNKNKIRLKKHLTKQAIYDSLLEGYH